MKIRHLSVAFLFPLLSAQGAPAFELKLKSGECLIGELISADAASVVFASPLVGRVTIAQGQIASLQPRGEGSESAAPAPVAEGGNGGAAPEAGGTAPDFGAKAHGARSEKPSTAEPAASAETATGTPVVGETLREEDIRQVFLRDSTILLKPGQFEGEGTLSYLRQEMDSIDSLFASNLRRFQRRLTQMQFGLRYSPAERFEISATLPVIYGEQQLVMLDGTSHHRQISGLGDFTLGVKWQALRENAHRPDAVFSVNVIAPTGRSPYRSSVADFGLGNGHWAVGAGLQLVRTYDPVVVFGGVDYTHYFAEDEDGGSIEPGGLFSYNLGFGFALNDQLSLSTQFAGSVQAEGHTHAANVRLPSRESMVLRMAMTARLSPQSYLEPAVAWGLSDDSPDYQLSLSYAQRF